MVVADGRPYLGHEGMVAYLADVDRAWDELDLLVDEIRQAGEHVVALGRVHAHGGGRVIDSPTGWVFRLREGRIVWGRVYETRAAALAEVGLER